MKPLVIDLFCGLGGWAEGFLSEGWNVIGFDVERHDYGAGVYPGQLVLQDVLTIDGAQFRHADAIVASPPCQAYSYRAMPWSQLAQGLQPSISAWEDDGGYSDEAYSLPPIDNRLFRACFRIQAEACKAAGHHIPMVVENVRGAERWIGPARWHYGSYFLWGDVPALMPRVRRSTKAGAKVPGISWSNHGKPGYVAKAFNTTADQRNRGAEKTIEHANRRDGHTHTAHLTNPVESAIKNRGGSWYARAHNTTSGRNRNPRNDVREMGVKQTGSGREWFDQGIAHLPSASTNRKFASAMIAMIPFELSSHIARCFQPHRQLL